MLSDAFDEPWKQYAPCNDADPALFFPSNYHPASEAVRVPVDVWCDGCPVRLPCLDYGLRHAPEDGIFGGTTPHQRVKIKRRRRERDAA